MLSSARSAPSCRLWPSSSDSAFPWKTTKRVTSLNKTETAHKTHLAFLDLSNLACSSSPVNVTVVASLAAIFPAGPPPSSAIRCCCCSEMTLCLGPPRASDEEAPGTDLNSALEDGAAFLTKLSSEAHKKSIN